MSLDDTVANTVNPKPVSELDKDLFKIDLKVKIRLLLLIKYKLSQKALGTESNELNREAIIQNYLTTDPGSDLHLNWLSHFAIDEFIIFSMIKAICKNNPDTDCDGYLNMYNKYNDKKPSSNALLEYFIEKFKTMENITLNDTQIKGFSKDLNTIIREQQEKGDTQETTRSKINSLIGKINTYLLEQAAAAAAAEQAPTQPILAPTPSEGAAPSAAASTPAAQPASTAAPASAAP